MKIIRYVVEFFGINNHYNDNIRDSSKIRYNEIHKMHDEIIKELGELAAHVSRNYIYERIQKKTGLSIRHISGILNHTSKKDLIV